MSQVLYIILGLAAGILSGLFGIGGGVILIPALVFIFGLTQHQAQGTTLAVMIPPIGLLAAIQYYYAGNVKIGIAVFIAIGFALGALLGAHAVKNLSDPILRKGFGMFLLFIALKMIFTK